MTAHSLNYPYVLLIFDTYINFLLEKNNLNNNDKKTTSFS